MVQPCVLAIYNGTSHTLQYEIRGRFKAKVWDPDTTMFIQSDNWDPPSYDRLTHFDLFDPIKVYKINYLKPYTYIKACYQKSNGELENYFVQEWDPENEKSLIGTLSAHNFQFFIKKDSTKCYIIKISIYRSGDQYKAEVINIKLDFPDNIKQINIGMAQADNYSSYKEYKEGDPYKCSPVCQTKDGTIPNPQTNCTTPPS
ncbi:hypothetical protein PDQ36_23875 [Bacillus cereus]|nr:hypothetical protein [Bacillus cereus]